MCSNGALYIPIYATVVSLQVSTCLCSIGLMKFKFTLERKFPKNVIETHNEVHATINISIKLEPDRIGGISVHFKNCPDLHRPKDLSIDQFWKRDGVLDIIVLVMLIFSPLTYINSILNTVKLYKVSIFISSEMSTTCIQQFLFVKYGCVITLFTNSFT